MHFHLPKPLHGWRELLGEVGIIVVGVLIALSAEQAVESWRWRHEAEKAIDSLRDEVGTQYFQSAEAVMTAPCVDRQLQTLEQSLLKQGEFVPVPLYTGSAFQFTYRAPLRNWSDYNWQSVMAEGAASHLDRELRLMLGAHYAQIAALGNEAADAQRLLWKLRVLAQPIRPDGSTRAHLIEELEQARGIYSVMALDGDQVIGRVDDMKLSPDTTQLNEALNQTSTVQFCREHHLPLGKVEPQH